MHVFIAGIYGVTLWVSIVAYEFAIGGPAHLFFFACPLIVSGAMAALLAIDYAVWKIQERAAALVASIRRRS